MTSANDREKHLQEWERSGLSKTAYAKSQGINRTTFYRWFREGKAGDEASEGFLRLQVTQGEKNDTSIGTDSCIEIYLPNEYRLIVVKGFDRETLAAIITLLEVR
jgi:hypothetical protein